MSRRNLLLGALLISVAINLLAAGVLLGRAGARPHSGPPPGAWAAQDLSPETRRRVRQQMSARVDAVRPLRAELRRAHGRIRSAVEAEPFDPEALRAALENLRSVGDRYQQLLHDNLVDMAADLPSEEREALIRAALERSRGGMRPGGPRRPGAREDTPPGRPPARG